MTSFLRCLVAFALPGALFAQSSATTAPATQPASFAGGGKQWAIDVTNRHLIAAMPADVTSIMIHRYKSAPGGETRPFNLKRPESLEGVDGIRTHIRAEGGSNFKCMHFSFGNFNGRSITVTLDSLEPVRRVFESGYGHDGAEIHPTVADGESIFVKRHLAMRGRVNPPRPDVWKTDYCAFLNQYCLVTAEKQDEMISMLRSLRREQPELSAEWSSLLHEDAIRAKTVILRQLRADRDSPQLHLIGLGAAKANGYCYVVSSHSPLRFRFKVSSSVALDDSAIFERELGKPEFGLEVCTNLVQGGFIVDAAGPPDCYFATLLYLYEVMLFGMPVSGL